jgi:protein gp37
VITAIPRLTRSFISPGNGADHRKLDLAWARDIRDRCASQDIDFFFKQVGGPTPKAGGRELDGRTWDQMPALAG